YTIGPMFRHERPQAGRFRQFHQLDVEALGEHHAAVDAEVIAMLVELFGRLGLASRLELQINSIGDENPDCRPHYRQTLVQYLRPTFELTTTELGAQNAVAGGGRYDGLIELLGGPADPAIGFAVGMERVVQLLAQDGDEREVAAGPRVVLIPLGEPALIRLLP